MDFPFYGFVPMAIAACQPPIPQRKGPSDLAGCDTFTTRLSYHEG